MTNLIFIILIVGALAGAEAIYHLIRYMGERKSDDLRRRLRQVGALGVGAQIFRKGRMAQSDSLSDLLETSGLFGGLEKLLEQTDLDLTVARLLGTMVGLSLMGLVVGWVLLRNPVLGVTLGAAGVGVPYLWVRAAREKRSAKLSEQLPDALEMMARASKAGYALPAAFKLVAQECSPPVAVEFAHAFEQQHFGVPFEEAVQSMAGRSPDNLDLRLFAVSVLVQKETGGNLVETLENISRTLRERFKFFSKLRALTAEGKVSMYILGSLPWAMAVFLMIVNPTYLKELTEGAGRLFMAGGIGFWLMGILWLRSLMKVDY
jgi:tight adherence protein B